MIRLDFGNPVIWIGVSLRGSLPVRLIINWIHHDRYGAIIFTSPIHTEFAIHNNNAIYSVFCFSFLKPLIIQKAINFNIAAWMRSGLQKPRDIYDLWLDYLPICDPDLKSLNYEDSPEDYLIERDDDFYYEGDED